MAATPPSTSTRPTPPPTPAPKHPTRRRAISIGVAAAASVGLASWAGVRFLGDEDGSSSPDSSSSPSETETPFVRQEWMSGAAGEGVADGSYAASRRSALDISATWCDNNDAQVALYTLQPGAEFAAWDKPLDVAVGAIDADEEGESWAEAAQGAYDDRWRESLTGLRDLWGDRQATMYIRFAHEMNGNWYPWEVFAQDADDFKTAWGRYRALQQEVFPASKLVFCLNRESVDTGIDWRETFPGRDLVDVVGVDYYNQFPSVNSQDEWDEAMTLTDQWGAPKGLDGFLKFAKDVDLPLAVPEWSGNSEEGDKPQFVKLMNDFFARNGGTGGGQLLYEVQFNVIQDEQEDVPDQWILVGADTKMPKSQEMYLSLDW